MHLGNCLRRRRREYGPIPFIVSFELAFIDGELTEEEYDQMVRKIVRRNLSCLLDGPDGEAQMWEEYNERVSEIIEEELSRN